MKNLIAISFMLAASLFFACSTVLVKGIGRSNFGEGVHPILIAYARFFFSFIFLTIVCCFIRPKIESLNKRLHFLRSCFGCLGVSILFTAVLYIPISDATAITFLNPIFAMFFAVILFKENIDLVRWGAALLSFMGGIILIRPTLNFNFDPVALLCLIGAIIMGLEIICIKILSGREKVFNILLFNNFYAMGIGSFIVPFYFNLVSFKEFIVLIIIALCMLIGQFCFIKSVKKAETSFLMPFFFITLIFVIILDLIFFNSLPDKISYLGATIIIIGSLVVAFRELHINKPNN